MMLRWTFGGATAVALALVAAQVVDAGLVTDITANADYASGPHSGNDAQGGGATGLAVINADPNFGTGPWTFVTDAIPADNTSTGTITLPFDVAGPFILSLKAADFFSLYLFNDSYAAGSEFTYTTINTATNPQGVAQGLSHVSLYTSVPSTVVPEFSSLAIWGGVMGVAGIAYRRRSK